MTIWQNRTVTIRKNTIVVFNMSQSGDNEGTPEGFAFHRLGFFDDNITDVHFTERPNEFDSDAENANRASSTLYVIARYTDCRIIIVELRLAESEQFLPILKVSILAKMSKLVSTDSGTPTDTKPFYIALGSAGSRLVWCGLDQSSHELVAVNGATLQLTRLDYAKMRSSVKESATGEAQGEDAKPSVTLDSSLIQNRGLPLLHDYPCLDFDDAFGVILIGTRSGELCLLRFREDSADNIFANGLYDDLPSGSDVEGIELDVIPVRRHVICLYAFLMSK